MNNEKSKHTPGPWSIDNGDLRASIEAVNLDFKSPGLTPMESETRIVASVPFGACGGRHEADAALIAAAPELLAALERALEEMHQGMDYDGPNAYPSTKQTIDMARAAIAKAKGE